MSLVSPHLIAQIMLTRSHNETRKCWIRFLMPWLVGYIIMVSPTMNLEKPCLMIWEKCYSTFPLKIKSLSEHPEISNALYSLTKFVLKPSSRLTKHSIAYTAGMCTETASNLHPGVSFDQYDFWKCLCDLLTKDADLKQYMLHLQVQAQLHGLHLHLCGSTSHCTFCGKVGISQFVVHVPVPTQTQVSGSFVFHFNVNQWEIDSVACKKNGDKIEVNLFFPSSFDIETLNGTDLDSYLCERSVSATHTYCFSKPTYLQLQHNHVFLFGEITSYSVKGDQVICNISINDPADCAGLDLKQTSCTSLRLSTASSKKTFDLMYPYTISNFECTQPLL